MRLGAESTSTLEFWRGFFNSPQRRRMAATHPFLAGKTAEKLAHAMPCAVHEDAGPISKRLRGNCLSFPSMIGKGPEKLTTLIVATSVKHNITDKGAWVAVLSDFGNLAS
eukprot:6558646-Pyramimonas_sp.AAC.1